MRATRGLSVLALVTLLVVVLAVWFAQPRQAPGEGGPLLPEFAARAQSHVRIVVHAPRGVVTLQRTGALYQVAEKDGYPARTDEVRKLLLGLAGLKRLEAKTRRADNYARLDLAEPGSAEGAATRITVYGKDDAVLADLYLGQRRAARADPLDSEYYVRLAGDPQVWLVEGRLPDRDRAIDWVESSLLKLDLARVKQVRVRHADGEEVIVRRTSPESADYTLAGQPDGAGVEAPHLVNNVATTMASLAFEDVRRAPADGAGKAVAFEAELQTFDGLTVNLEVRDDAGASWASLAARGNAAPLPADKQDGAAARDVAAEAAALNERWSGWSYAISPYQVEALRKRRAELLAGKPAAAPRP